MKKNIIIAASLAICIALLSIGAYATTSMNETIITPVQPTNSDLQSALDSSNVLASMFKVKNIDTIDNDEPTSEIPSVSADNAVKVYNVDISENSASINQQINKENDYWMIPQVINGKMSFIYLKKGDDIKTAAQKINNVNVSEARKEKMMEKAAERAGKWYVTKIETQVNTEASEAFINQNAVNSVNGLTQKEYIYITNTNTLAIWAKTDSGEYVIPYVSNNTTSDYNNNTAYTIEAISDIIAE